jgi:hypothetical protein
MNKKALERKYLIWGVIGVLVLFLAVVLIVRAINSMSPGDQACHETVVYRGTAYEVSENIEPLKVIEQEAMKSAKLACKTNEVTIDSDNPEEIKREFADEIARCWAMLGEGKVNFFGRGWNDETRCVICTKINFSEKSKSVGEIRDFGEYMAKTPVPGKEDTGITYTDFLAGAKEHLQQKDIQEGVKQQDEKNINPDEALFGNSIVENSVINPSSGNKYVIVYTLWDANKFWAVVGGGAGMAALWTLKSAGKKAADKSKYLGAAKFMLVDKWGKPIRDSKSGEIITLKTANMPNSAELMRVQAGQRFVAYSFNQGQNLEYKGGQLVGSVAKPVTGVLLKPRPIATWGGSATSGLIWGVVSQAGTLAYIASYWGGSSAVDSLRKVKYIGFISPYEYTSDELDELGCTHLDVTP